MSIRDEELIPISKRSCLIRVVGSNVVWKQPRPKTNQYEFQVGTLERGFRGNASTSLEVFNWSRNWIFQYKEKHNSRDAKVRQPRHSKSDPHHRNLCVSPYRCVPRSPALHSIAFAEVPPVSACGSIFWDSRCRPEYTKKLQDRSIDLKRAAMLLDRDFSKSIQDMCGTTKTEWRRYRR
jgi:hypothetical protein